jgi:hypothetical protein
MPETATVAALVDRFLAHHAAFAPVDATFIGLPGADHLLPPADPDVRAEEDRSLAELERALDGIGEAEGAGERMDLRLLRAAILHARLANEARPRVLQPCWYTGEAAFGLISLLLPSGPPGAEDAMRRRLQSIPRFLDEGVVALAGRPQPPDWISRAMRECDALQRLLGSGLRLHPFWNDALEEPCRAAMASVARFRDGLAGHEAADPACGRDYLAMLMRDVHGLPWSPEEALAMAGEAMARLGETIAEAERRSSGDDLALIEPAGLPAAYRIEHDRAMAAAIDLVTPAAEYALAFAPLPDWARQAAPDLYFLSYRSPPAFNAGAGSVYWTAPVGQQPAAVRQTHAVHHGSIGHHTQNTRARAAPSRLARLGGTDCAIGIAFLSSGTMVEGWSSYTTGLIGEVEGFYTPAEAIAELRAELRNAASAIADIRLHTGDWPLERMRSFYVEEAGFPAARVWNETVRNSILPGTRLMYHLGVEQIRALRREFGGEPRAFHDELISHGHAPVAWVGEEMRRARSGAG